MSNESFIYKNIPAFGKRVHRLGIAPNYGIDENGLRSALERGMNYIFYPPMGSKKIFKPLSEAFARGERDRFVLATGPTMGYFGGMVRSAADSVMKKLNTEYIDLLQLGWLGRASAWTDGTSETLKKYKESGKAHAIGVSIHDRPRAGRLAEDSPLDALMIRYNAAHPGAEQDIFPKCDKRHPAIIAYTATNWKKLMQRPSGWQKAVPTAGDCYRFCLSNPYVDVVLCGPGSLQELDDNLKAMEKGPLDPEEMAWMREFGKVVSGKEIIPRQASWM